MEARYAEHLPLVEGAFEAVERLAGSFRLALASSSNRPLIDAVLAGSRLAGHFEVTVSSEEVERGKPAPDVFLEAARSLRVAPLACAAIEDSGNGIRAASAAGMRVIAIPNRRYRRRRMRWRLRTPCSTPSPSSHPHEFESHTFHRGHHPPPHVERNVEVRACGRRLCDE